MKESQPLAHQIRSIHSQQEHAAAKATLPLLLKDNALKWYINLPTEEKEDYKLNKQTVITVINPTNQDITLPADKSLATVHAVSLSDIHQSPEVRRQNRTFVNSISSSSKTQQHHRKIAEDLGFSLEYSDLSYQERDKFLFLEFLGRNRSVFAKELILGTLSQSDNLSTNKSKTES